jgi:membrane protein DedA with SNARE-associated domain
MLLATALVAIWVAETLARAWLPLLVRDHPLLLIMLDARTHNVLLASPKVGTAELIIVAVAWRFTVHWLYYLLGRWYGDSALRWVARKSKLGGRIADRVERAFRRVAGPAVFFLSDKLVCVLAGLAGMSPVLFVALHLPGTVLRVVVLSMLARSSHRSLNWIVDLIDRNAVWLTVVFAVVTITMIVLSARLHRRGPQGPTAASTVSESAEASPANASRTDASTSSGPKSGARDEKAGS